MRFGRRFARLERPLGEQLADLVEGLGALEAVRRGALESERLDVPGIELAQVAGRPLGAPVLLRPVEHPAQLRLDLGVGGRTVALAGELGEDPGVAERPARDHHRVGPGLDVGSAGQLGGAQPAGDDHRHPGPAPARARRRARRPARTSGWPRWRWPAARGCRVTAATPASATSRWASARPVRSPGSSAGSQLHRHRQARALAAALATATARSWSSSRAAPAPVFRTFGTGQPMLRSISRGPRLRRPWPQPRASPPGRSRRAGSRPGPRRDGCAASR